MKNRPVIFLLVISFFSLISKTEAQTLSTFENLTLPADSFWNGSDYSGGFTNGAGYFVNSFTDWGGGITSWAGYAYSNMKDTTTPGYANQYSAFAGSGFGGSSNFAIGYCYPTTKIKLNESQRPKVVEGFYVSNTTYAVIAMRDGDAYCKIFGGVTGNDPDWFKLSVWGYHNGAPTDTVAFYLADYRFANNDSDYIVKDWRWVDLASLGNIDSIEMVLSSTDNGQYGMNTPAYYCMDNLTVDYLPELEHQITANCLNSCQFNYFRLDTVFSDFDTPDSILHYELISNSNPLYFIAEIHSDTLQIFAECTTKDELFMDSATLVIRIFSSDNFIDYSFTFCADILENIITQSIPAVRCYPNPAQYNITIETGNQCIGSVEILDVSGKTIIRKSNINSGKYNYDISGLHSGLYFIKIQNSGVEKTFKIIKQ
ncbi:MAG: DUF4465 domain-containing protein [Bacteroidia bacterium]|nr:DUF4465 domain-containing protein [Bacteroidia bacterium]